jgi:tetratricopeptide (TPR) repeat protein
MGPIGGARTGLFLPEATLESIRLRIALQREKGISKMTKIRIQARGAMLAAVAVCTFLLAGCQGHSPQSAANNYLGNLKLYNYPAAYQALSHQDQVDRSMDQFLSEIPMAPDVSKDWFKGILQKYDYKVGDAKVDGDKAVVTVSVTAPDLALWERTVDAGLSGEQTPDSIAQKNLQENTYPKVTYDDNMVMVQQGGEWRLLVDFPFKENILKEHKDAVNLYHQHDYDKAIAAYQKILDELDKEQASGNAGLKFQYGRELADIQNAQKQQPDAQAYIPKIVLSDVDMKMSASRVPGIFGKMTNTGDKPIDEVQFTVTYSEGKGKKKKDVFTEVHTPVATALEFTNFGRAVLPFVPGETRSFGFRLTASPEVQQKATPDLTVTSIVFTQSSAPLPKPPTPSPAASPGASPAAAGSAAAAPAAAASH